MTYGNTFINGQASYNLTSAEIARMRLLGVLQQDREQVPAYRWVRVGRTWRNYTGSKFNRGFLRHHREAWRLVRRK